MGQQDILEARKSELLDSIKSILDTADGEKRGISDAEQIEIDGHHAEIRATDAKLASYTAVKAHLDERGRTLDAGRGTPLVIDVPDVPALRTEERSEVYRQGGKESYFADLLRMKQGDIESRERLVRNDRQRNDLERRAGETSVAGAGGELAPPLWAIDQFVTFLRAGRVFADRLNKKTLPAGVSSINLPKITGGTAVAAQSTQNTAINQQDITTTSVSTPINTLAGGALISMQLIEQSPVSIDDIILQDLANDLAKKIDVAAITAVAAVSGLNAVTYTDASPTSIKILNQIQNGIDTVNNAIFRQPDTIVMRPERWGKIVAAGDSQGRPLVLPSSAMGPNNALGVANGAAQGYAGNARGLDVFLDPNIPANLGGGTNQDEIFVLSAKDVFLYESSPKFETFEQTYAGSLALYARGYEYYGIIANRYPGAISLISGTGLVTTLAYGS